MTIRPSCPVALLATVMALSLPAQDARITSWRLNLNGATGSSPDPTVQTQIASIPADVEEVRYDGIYVYAKASAIPSHEVGLPTGNPNAPRDQSRTWRIPRMTVCAVTPAETPLGPIGVGVNGVPFFNPWDALTVTFGAMTSGGAPVLLTWRRNAQHFERQTFDAGKGHATGNPDFIYHYHVLPELLLAQQGDSGGVEHSPIIGWSFDGYPVYGPYGYANPTGTGGIDRMRSSYQMKSIRLGGPSTLIYPLGSFLEDFVYVAGLGDLDAHNGRFTVTPEYPQGTYAYFATIDESGEPAYPYLIGPTYFGIAAPQPDAPAPAGTTAWTRATQPTGCGHDGFKLEASVIPMFGGASLLWLGISESPTSSLRVFAAYGLRPKPLTYFLGSQWWLDESSAALLEASGFSPFGPITAGPTGTASCWVIVPAGVSSLDLQAVSTTVPYRTSNALTVAF